jgi:hypothetical protein
MKCPGPDCDVEIDDDDLFAQSQHMEEHHPEIIEERRREVERWDGWENQ